MRGPLRGPGIVAAMLLVLSGCTPTSPPAPPIPKNVTGSTSQAVGSKPTTVTTPVAPRGPVFGFRDATRDWNLDFTRFDDIQGQNLIMEGPGGGIAVFDYDIDGRLDALFCQGSRLPRSKVTEEFSNELYRNTDGLKRVTGPASLTASGYHTGVAAGDIDEDGFPDLVIGAYGRSSIWHNNGDGTFRKQDSAGVVDSWSTSPLLADLNDDGLLDLLMVTYLQAEDDPPRICKEPRSPTGTLQCPPTLFPALDDWLFLNDGAGDFVEVTQAAGITGKDGKGLAVVACDFNGDGTLEIAVINDGTPQFLYVRREITKEPDGMAIPRFEERGAELGIALSGEGRTISGMSAAHGDYDRNGWADLFVTNFYLEPNVLFRNLGEGNFTDHSTASRLGPPSRLTLAFGAEFFDVDHDAWLDLVVTTGHIEDRSWSGQEPYRMLPQLYRNDQNGRFTDVAGSAGSYFTSKWVGRGLALGDLDRDGDLDVCISHRDDPSVLLLNETPKPGTSVIIRPVGRNKSPRCGIGTKVVAKGVSPPLFRDVVGGGSFQSASALEMHFGLGELQQFDELECRWADGEVERWANVKPGYYVAVQGRGLILIGGPK